MKTLIIGGAGGIGAYIALQMRKNGDQVAIGTRRPVPEGSPVADFPVLMGDYAQETFTADQLAGFDTMIFSAGADVRQLPKGLNEEEVEVFYKRVNGEMVPRFFELAKKAGIKRTAYIGSFYPQAYPQALQTSSYVRGRKLADEGVRAHASKDFHVVSLNASWVVGVPPGMHSGLYEPLAKWALGLMPQVPVFAPPGGTNYVSVKSVCEATLGGLERGENGRGYLLGDENWYYKDLFEKIFRLCGNDSKIEVRDEEHPIMNDRSLFAGRAGTIFFETEGAEELGYTRHDVDRELAVIVKDVRAKVGK